MTGPHLGTEGGGRPAEADQLSQLAAGLSRLDEAPVADHPEALEDLHRRIVAELDSLGGGRGAAGEAV